MPLSPHRRRSELEQAVRESNVRRVIELVGSYGLSASDRVNLAQELHRRAVTNRDEYPGGGLDDSDWGGVVAEVWREGVWASWPRSRSARLR
jgi:hypothetical protein